MWAWLRLGWARGLLLAALLSGANMAAQRYAQDTATATRTPEYSSLGGLRAWRLSFESPRRAGLLDQVEWADARSLLQWSTGTGGSQTQPSLWNTGMGVWVQEPHERGGSVHSVVVVAGIDWPADACWILSTTKKPDRMDLLLDQQTSCVHEGATDHNRNVQLAQTQQDIKSLWSVGPPAVVLGTSLARRALGDDWAQFTSGVWVGTGSIPLGNGDSTARATNVTPTPTPVSLENLQTSGWRIHEIRNAPSALQQKGQQARQHWQWAMAALGFAVGILAAWGYRQVLALMAAIRRTGGAGWLPRWLDALRLSFALAMLMIVGSAVPLTVQSVCGASCAAMATHSWQHGAQAVGQWMLWPWAGLTVGLLLANSVVVVITAKQPLQAVFARGARG